MLCEELIALSLQRKSMFFMEPEDFVLSLKDSTTGPSPERNV